MRKLRQGGGGVKMPLGDVVASQHVDTGSKKAVIHIPSLSDCKSTFVIYLCPGKLALVLIDKCQTMQVVSEVWVLRSKSLLHYGDGSLMDVCSLRRDIPWCCNHRQKWDAEIAKFKFCASRIVNVVIPMRLPRSSNTPPPLDPGDTGAVIWTYSTPSSDRRKPDNKPS
jgi:hypothetical protein